MNRQSGWYGCREDTPVPIAAQQLQLTSMRFGDPPGNGETEAGPSLTS